MLECPVEKVRLSFSITLVILHYIYIYILYIYYIYILRSVPNNMICYLLFVRTVIENIFALYFDILDVQLQLNFQPAGG